MIKFPPPCCIMRGEGPKKAKSGNAVSGRTTQDFFKLDYTTTAAAAATCLCIIEMRLFSKVFSAAGLSYLPPPLPPTILSSVNNAVLRQSTG